MAEWALRLHHREMHKTTPAARRPLSIVDFGSLLFLGAVWGAAFLFLRIAAPEVGPAWAAEIRLAIGAAVLLALAGPATLRVARRRATTFLIVGALFSAVPFTLIAVATVTLPAGFAACSTPRLRCSRRSSQSGSWARRSPRASRPAWPPVSWP